MTDWNPLVNTRFYLEGDHGLSSNVARLKFASGKPRTYLKNKFAFKEYPSLELALDNKVLTKSGYTEYEEFQNWYKETIGYGTIPFQIQRIGYKPKVWYIKQGEIGIYQFMPDSLKWDRIEGIALASFGLEEIGYIPEVEYVFRTTMDGKILLTMDGRYRVIA